MPEVASLLAKIDVDSSAAEAKLAGFGRQVDVFGVAMGTALGNAMSTIASKMAEGVGAAIKGAGDLQQAVANVSTIKPTIDTSGVFGALNEMQTRVPQSAAQLGDALYNVFSSVDVSQEQALALVETFAKGATGAATDAATFGTSILGVLNAYGLAAEDAAHVSDVFFNTVNAGVVTGQELASSLGPVTQSAKAAGVSLDELGGLIAGVTKEGGPAAQNINNLNNFLTKMSTKEAQAQLNALGVATVDATGKFRPTTDVLGDLKVSLGGMTEAARANALQAIFPDLQARQGASTLISQLDFVNQAIDANKTQVGSAASAYEKMSATFNSQSKLLGNTLQSILTQIGAEVLPAITPLVTAFAQQLPAAFASAKAALAPFGQIAKDAFGTIQQVFAQDWSPDASINPIVNAIGLLAIALRDQVIPAIQQFAGFMTGTFLPALVTAGPTIAIAVAAFAGFQILTGIATAIAGVVAAISGLAATFTAAGSVIGGIVAILGGPVTVAILAIVAISAVLAAAWVNNWGDIQGKTAAVAGVVLPILEQIGAALGRFAEAAIPALAAAWGRLQAVIAAAMTAINGVVKAGMQVLSGDWSGAWQTLVDTAGSVFDQISAVVSAPLEALNQAISAALDGISQFISDTLNGWGSAIGTALGGIGEAIGGAFSGFGTTIHDALSGITSAVGETFNGIGTAIHDTLDGIGRAIGEKWQGFLDTIGGALDGIHQKVTDVWNQIPEDIRTDLDKITAALGEKFGTFVTDVTTGMGNVAAAIAGAWDGIVTTAGLKLAALELAISGAWTTITTEVGTGWDAIKLAIAGKWDEITTALGLWLTPLGTAISTAWTTISTEATTGWDAISTAISGVWDTITSALATWLTTNVQTPISTAWGTITSEATTGWENFRQAIADKLQAVGGVITTFISTTSQALSGFITEAGRIAGQIGTAITDGIGTGIRAGSDALGRLVAGVVRGLLDQAKAALGISSPSTEFALIGQQSIDGFIAGVVAKTGAARDAVEAVVTAAIRNGMDPIIALALAKAESGLNPRAVGDQGHSVGLFQLHDQGQGAGMSVAQRQDPQANADTFLNQHKALYDQLVASGLTGAELATIFGGQAEQSVKAFWDRYGTAYTQLAGTLGPTLATTTTGALQPVVVSSGQVGQSAAQALTPLQLFIAGLQPIAGVAAAGSTSAGQLQASIVGLAASTGLSAGPLAAMQAGTLDSTAAFQQLMTQLGSVDPSFGALAASMDAAGGSSNQATAQFLALATSTSSLSAGAQQATGTWGSFLSGMQPVLAQMAAGTTTAGSLQAQIVQLAASTGLAAGPFAAMQAGTMDSTAAFEALVSQLAVTHPEFAAIITEMNATGGSSNAATADFGALVLALGGVGTGAAATSQAVTLLGQDMTPLVAQVQAGQISTTSFEQALVSMASASGAAVAPAQALAAGQISLNDAVKQVIDSVNIADPRYADLKAKLDAGTISSNDAAVAFAKLVSSGLNPIPAPTGVATKAVDTFSTSLNTADKTAGTVQVDVSKSVGTMNTDTTTAFGAMFKAVTDNMTLILTKISDTLTAMLDATKLQTSTMVTTTQDNTKAMVSAVDTNGKAMVQATTTNTDQMVRVTTDNGTKMVGAVGKAMTDANTTVQNNQQPFRGALDTGYSGAVPATTSMGINVSKELANNAKAALRPAQDIGTAIVNGMIAGISQREGALYSKIKSVVDKAISAAKDAADSHSPSERFAVEVGEPIADGLALGIDRHAGLAVDAARRMVEAVISASRPPADVISGITAGIPTTVGGGGGFATGIAAGTSTSTGGGTSIPGPVVAPPDTSGVQASIDAIAAMLNDLSIKVQGFTIDVKNLWLTLWKDLGNATIDGVTNVRDPIWKLLVPIATNWILPLSLSIMGLLKSAWVQAGKDATDFAAAFVAEMQTMVAGVAEQFTTLQQTIGRMLEQVASTAGQQSRSIGQQIVSGVAQGMYDSASQIQNAAQALVYAAQSAAQGAARIHSPSQLMAETVGAPLGLGVAQGLLGTRGHIRSAMDDLLRPTTAYGPPPSVGTYTSAGNQQPTVQYNVTVSGVGLDEVATEIVRRLGRREALGARA